MPGEVKVLTRTEYKTIRDESMPESAVMDVPKYPDEPVEDHIGSDAADVAGYETAVEETQADKFERSMAGENETATTTEETSAVAPEEAPPEIIPPEVEEPSED